MGRKESDMTEQLNWTELKFPLPTLTDLVHTTSLQGKFNDNLYFTNDHTEACPCSHI